MRTWIGCCSQRDLGSDGEAGFAGSCRRSGEIVPVRIAGVLDVAIYPCRIACDRTAAPAVDPDAQSGGGARWVVVVVVVVVVVGVAIVELVGGTVVVEVVVVIAVLVVVVVAGGRGFAPAAEGRNVIKARAQTNGATQAIPTGNFRLSFIMTWFLLALVSPYAGGPDFCASYVWPATRAVSLAFRRVSAPARSRRSRPPGSRCIGCVPPSVTVPLPVGSKPRHRGSIRQEDSSDIYLERRHRCRRKPKPVQLRSRAARNTPTGPLQQQQSKISCRLADQKILRYCQAESGIIRDGGSLPCQ